MVDPCMYVLFEYIFKMSVLCFVVIAISNNGV